MASDAGTLRVFELFRACDDEELRLLSGVMLPRSATAGQVICRQGEAGSSCFLLVRGAVVVYKEIPGRGRVEFAPLLPGAIFGQVSLLDGRPRLATCEARGPVRLLELTGEAIDALRAGHPRLATRIQRELSRSLVRQLRMANQRLGELEDHDLPDQDARLVDLLNDIRGG